MPLNKLEILEIYQQSQSLTLGTTIESLITSSTLSAETLKFVGSLVQRYEPACIFEFGSGLSTQFLVDILGSNSFLRLFSVDHSRYYLQKTKSMIGGAKNVTLLLCPIKLYQFRLKGFATYDSAYIRQIPQGFKFDFVLIDGPPARRFGREAPLYQIAPFLTSETLILLDDANRSPEQEALSNWRRVWPGGIDFFNIPELKSGFSVLQVRNPDRMARFPFQLQDIASSWLRATKRVLGVRVRGRK